MRQGVLTWINVENRVPHGSLIGIFGYNIFTNDLTYQTSRTRLSGAFTYSNDYTLFTCGKTYDEGILNPKQV